MDRGVDAEPGPERSDRGGNGRPPWFGAAARFQDYLFLTRPMILIPVWTFYLLGAYHGMRGDVPDTGRLLAGAASFTALMGAVYIINQITDRDADRANRKLFLVPDGIVSPGAARIEAAVLIAVAFLIAAFLSARFAIVLAAGLALGVAYSVDPVRLKKRAALDVLANAVGNGILNTLAGWAAIGAPLDGWYVLAPYPFAVASVHLTTTLADIRGDAAAGLRTSGVLLGARAGLPTAAALMAAAAVAAALAGNRPALYASLASLPAFLIPAGGGRGERPHARLLFPAKVSTLIYSIVTGFLFPLYLPVLAVVILLTRRYYGARFGMRYPSL